LYPADAQRLSLRLATNLILGSLSSIFVSNAGTRTLFAGTRTLFLACNCSRPFLAPRRGKVERHIRLLAPLAFVSPKIVSSIIDGSAPADLTVTSLAKTHAYSWAEQGRRVGL
jgi:hypothetical protein